MQYQNQGRYWPSTYVDWYVRRLTNEYTWQYIHQLTDEHTGLNWRRYDFIHDALNRHARPADVYNTSEFWTATTTLVFAVVATSARPSHRAARPPCHAARPPLPGTSVTRPPRHVVSAALGHLWPTPTAQPHRLPSHREGVFLTWIWVTVNEFWLEF
jgi:hypothetical protein